MTNRKIKLRCPKCGREQLAQRLDYDPPEAVVALIGCDNCTGGDFGETRYLTADGSEVPFVGCKL